MFNHMVWMKAMAFRNNWNEFAIHQFYATLEVNMEEESLAWMTGKERLKASFRELAQDVELDYDEMNIGGL